MTNRGDKLLRRGDVALRLNVSRWTVARLECRDPTFPKFRELTPGVWVVPAAEFEAWLARRLAAPIAPACTNSHVAPADHRNGE